MKTFLAFIQETTLARLVHEGTSKNMLRPRGGRPASQKELSYARKMYRAWKAKKAKEDAEHERIERLARSNPHLMVTKGSQ